jgi:hypothetical protein
MQIPSDEELNAQQVALKQRIAEIDQRIARERENRNHLNSMANNLQNLSCLFFLLPVILLLGLLSFAGCISMFTSN